MHFFNPPPISRLIEVIYGTKTGSVAVATVIEVSKRLQKVRESSHIDYLAKIRNEFTAAHPYEELSWILWEPNVRPILCSSELAEIRQNNQSKISFSTSRV